MLAYSQNSFFIASLLSVLKTTTEKDNAVPPYLKRSRLKAKDQQTTDAWVEVTQDNTSREKQLFNILQQSPTAFVVLRRQHHIIEFINEKACEIWQREAENITGKAYLDVFPELRAQGFEDILNGVFTSGDRYTSAGNPVVFRKGKSAELCMDLTCEPVRDEHGKIEGILCFGNETNRHNDKEVKASEERLRLAMLSAELGTWDFDLEHNILEWSPRTRVLFGVEDDTPVTYELFLEAMHPEDRLRIDNVIQGIFSYRNNGEFDEEYRVVTIGNKQLRWLRAKGKVFYDNAKKPYRFIGTLLDITDKKLFETRLIESESRFRNMADTVPAMIWITRTDASCTYLNKRWYEYTGQTPATALGMGWLDSIHPDDRERAKNAYLEAARKETTFSTEYRLRATDGTYQWMYDGGSPRYNGQGEFKGLTGCLINITEQRIAAEHLSRLAAIVESSDDAIISKTLEGIVTSWNNSAERIFGYKAEEMIGKPITRLIPDDRKEEEPAILERLKKGQRVDHFQTKRITKDGRLIDISLTISPVKDSIGNVIGASKTARDITNERLLHEALIRSEQDYRELTEVLPVAVYTCDKDGYITFYNKAATELWGVEPKIGKTRWCGSWKLYDSDGVIPIAAEECPLAVAIKTGRRPPEREIVIQRPDGTKRNVLPSPRLIYDTEGNISGAMNLLTDITEQKTAQEHMSKLAAIVESSDDAIISKTLEGIITSWNTSAQRIFGYTAEEMIGTSILRLIPDDRKDEEPAILERLKKGERVDHFGTKRVTKDGRLLDISLTISPIKDGTGKVIGASKIARDVTNEQLLHKALVTSEQNYRELVEALPAAIYTCDKDGYITLYNNAAVELWGIRPEIGKDLWCGSWKIYDTDGVTEIPLDTCPMAQVLREGRSVSGREIIVERPDGERRNVLPHPKPLFDSAGNISGAVNMLIDITELKKIENALKASEQRLRTIADSAPVMIWMAGTDMKCYFFNKVWLDFTGLKKQGDQINSWAEKVHPDDRDACLKAYIEAFNERRELVMEYRLQRKDGEYRWMLGKSIPLIDSDENFNGYIGSCIDITDRIELERHKDELIGIASHELKTPVTSVKLYTEMLREIFEMRGDTESAEMMARLETQVDRLAALISDFLDVTKIQSGNFALNVADFDLRKSVDEITDLMQLTTERHQLIREVDVPPHVKGDKERLAQVLTNFITNAIKYSPDPSDILIRVVKSDGSIIFSVTDKGIGIPENMQKKVFDRFFRIDHKQSVTYPGIGLGLYISAEIVRLHGGKIWLKSTEGEGSTFYFSIPYAS